MPNEDRIYPQNVLEALAVATGENEEWVRQLRIFHVQTHAYFGSWLLAQIIIEDAQYGKGPDNA